LQAAQLGKQHHRPSDEQQRMERKGVIEVPELVFKV
jgi:hypothetical protein